MSITITTLGTGSGKPTLVRNVSATTLQRDGDMVLFDCGEGTQIQFQRAKLRTSRLRVICITHMHGDHLNGLPGLLGTMALNHHEGTLTLVGPAGVRDYLNVLTRHHVYFPSFEMVFVPLIKAGGEVFRNDHFRIEALPLRHRIPTWGFRWIEHDKPGRFDLDAARALGIPSGPLFGKLQRGETITLDDGRHIHPDQVLGPTRPGKVVAYCTDTSPCDNAVALGQNADVMIHEGTFAPELGQQARQRGHSTVTQAARAAKRAQAKRLIITHISPKHTDSRALQAAAREVFPNTVLAHDLKAFEVD